jgi:predicted hotdog family 3-hydroxylacyl-ACP dehydratase
MLMITFQTIRHWKAIMGHHQTKDLLHVRMLLEHRKLNATTLYFQIAEALSHSTQGAFAVKVAETQEGITAHPQLCFEQIGEKDGLVSLSIESNH